MSTESFDVLIVGAGLSGIGAGFHLQRDCPGKSYVILENRAAIGGTWDLFRYPGIRSDSDMFTLGYSFKPWTEEKAIADGPSIWKYVHETAAEYGIDKHIRFKHRVVRASWSSEDALWTIEAESEGATKRPFARFWVHVTVWEFIHFGWELSYGNTPMLLCRKGSCPGTTVYTPFTLYKGSGPAYQFTSS